MAVSKRSGGGGSNTGLIVTLVFFVLATVILGVMTYLGFDGQAEKEKAKAEAEKKLKIMEDERAWWRFQVRLFRHYIGKPAKGLDTKDLMREKVLFDKGQLTYAGSQPDKAEVTQFVKEELEKTMPWDATRDDVPKSTYESRLNEKDRKNNDQLAANDKLKKDKDEFERQLKEARDLLEEEKKNFKDTIAKIADKAENDRKTDRATIDQLQKDLGAENANKENVRRDLEGTQKKLATSEANGKRLAGLLNEAKIASKDLRDRLDDTTTRLTSIAAKTGVNLQAAEAEALDAKAIAMLKSWTKQWKVVEMDRRGTMPYINMGSSDGLTAQITFSVHSLGLDGGLNEKPKGTVEVVRVIGPHLSQVRVTSVKDARVDPIMKGDRLFNPTWDPARKRHVALAGMADLGGDGTDNTEDFRRLLERQNVVLDGWIDTKDEKAPKAGGKGVTSSTDYLIVGDSLEAVNSPRKGTSGYNVAFDRIATDMKNKAVSNGVTVITLRRYLDMIGYRAPKVTSSGSR